METSLAGRTIVVPETRELDLLSQLLEQQGAIAVRCPMVSIHDVADAAPVNAWLRRFIAQPPDDLILLTGEGLRRLLGFARRLGGEAAFIAALGKSRTVTRGPKPARALREIGLKAGLTAEAPTTDGVIASLGKQDLTGRRIGVQLYGDEPNLKLIEFLSGAGAEPDPVRCYDYASQADDQRVAEIIEALAAGHVDAIAFTSSPQVRRLCDVARALDLGGKLTAGLARTKVAAVGPIVAEALTRIGARVDIAPAEAYFMKPLVAEIAAAFARA